jgi:hypothetical protein
MRGAESRMGFVAHRNLPFGPGVIQQLLELMKEEMEFNEEEVSKEYAKFGAAVTTSICASLPGPEVFLLDLAGLQKCIGMGREGALPADPLRVGRDLSRAPYVMIALIGEFKGELGARHHLMAFASTTTTGIELRWWLEQLMKVCEQEGWTKGPAFGNSTGEVALMSEYEAMLHFFLKKIHIKHPWIIDPKDEVETSYSFFRSFRRTGEGRERAAGLNSSSEAFWLDMFRVMSETGVYSTYFLLLLLRLLRRRLLRLPRLSRQRHKPPLRLH